MAKGKTTRTARYMLGKLQAHGFDGKVLVPADFLASTVLHRLSFSALPSKEQYKIESIAQSLAGRDDILVICDTSVFDDRMPASFWEALTDSPKKLVLTPRVRQELREWLRRRPRHPMANILDPDTSRADLVQVSAWSDAEQGAYLHYVNILALRKSALTLAGYEFEREHGRPPTSADAHALRSWIHKNFGERGMMFAKKGGQLPKPRPQKSYTDEEVVYVAFILALKTGRETVILTRDEDLVDQFYRLGYLIDSHYRSMLIARRYRSDFASFRTHQLPPGGAFDNYFARKNGILVERSENLPQEVLPSNYQFVPVQCHVLGELYSWIAFGAEQEMYEVILNKGKRDGANSSLLLPRNCHLFLPGLEIPPETGLVFVVAEDRHVILPKSGRKIPIIDMNQGFANERFKHYEEKHPLQP